MDNKKPTRDAGGDWRATGMCGASRAKLFSSRRV
jgi:hypothetical protein